MPRRRFWFAILLALLIGWSSMPVTVQAAPPQSGGKVHKVRRGETLSGIAVRYGVSVRAIARANHIKNRNRIYAGMRLWIPTGSGNSSKPPANTNGSRYVVRRGDTLSAIARRYGVTISALRQANNIRNVNRIRVGQNLIIPGGSQPAASPPPTSPPAPAPGNGRKWIEIDLSQQRLIAHEGDRIILNTLVSTGLRMTPTPVGRYRVRVKIRSQTMSGPGYRLPNVQWVMYFVGAYALHGTYWHNNFGHPMSHGCVNLRNRDARTLYKWAGKGTLVVIHR